MAGQRVFRHEQKEQQVDRLAVDDPALGAVGLGIVGGTLLRQRAGALGLVDRYGCLLPGIGLGGLGFIGVVGGLLLYDPDIDPIAALLLAGASLTTGLVASYGFSKRDYGLGLTGSYGLGAGSLLLSGGLAFGLSGTVAAPQPPATPAQPTPTASAAPSPTASASPTASPSATPTTGSVTASPTVPIGERSDFFDALVELGALSDDRVDEYMEDYQLDPTRARLLHIDLHEQPERWYIKAIAQTRIDPAVFTTLLQGLNQQQAIGYLTLLSPRAWG